MLSAIKHCCVYNVGKLTLDRSALVCIVVAGGLLASEKKRK